MRAAVALSVVLALAGVAHAETALAARARVFLDGGKKVEAREEALRAALALARSDPSSRAELAGALGTLLSDLRSKRADPAWARLVTLALDAARLAEPRDAGAAVRPYLATDGARPIQLAALRVLVRGGPAGTTKDLLALVARVAGGAQQGEPLLRLIGEVAAAASPPDALALHGALLEQGAFPLVHASSCRALADLVIAGARAADARKVLIAACGSDDLSRACAAAPELWRAGSPEGVDAILAKVETDLVYGALCAVLQSPTGFARLAPDRFADAAPAERAPAIAALREAWKNARTRGPEALLLDALAAAGVRVPANRAKDGKALVVALIDGLDLEARDLRRQCLDLLARRTRGREAAIRAFTTLEEKVGSMTIARAEPPEGFEREADAAKLRAQQRERVTEWRTWWQALAPRAKFVEGAWIEGP